MHACLHRGLGARHGEVHVVGKSLELPGSPPWG